MRIKRISIILYHLMHTLNLCNCALHLLTVHAVPNEVNGFSLDSSLSTAISISWNDSIATVDYYRVGTLHVHIVLNAI